jgi:ABC-type sugar transport system ATPase subunit
VSAPAGPHEAAFRDAAEQINQGLVGAPSLRAGPGIVLRMSVLSNVVFSPRLGRDY